jgi:hypothetical protein
MPPTTHDVEQCCTVRACSHRRQWWPWPDSRAGRDQCHAEHQKTAKPDTKLRSAAAYDGAVINAIRQAHANEQSCNSALRIQRSAGNRRTAIARVRTAGSRRSAALRPPFAQVAMACQTTRYWVAACHVDCAPRARYRSDPLARTAGHRTRSETLPLAFVAKPARMHATLG